MSTAPYDRSNTILQEMPGGLVLRRKTSVPKQEIRRRESVPKPMKTRKNESRREASSISPRGVFTILIVILSVALVMEILFHLFISPRLSIEHIHINPGEGITVSEEMILRTAGITGRTNYFSVNTDLITENLSALPFVRGVEVSRSFPDTLTISLIQREAVAVILVETKEMTVPALIDGEGILFDLGTFDSGDLPVLSGIRIEEPRAGMVLPEALRQFLSDMDRIKQTSPALLTLISEFKFIKKDGSQYEVLMYPEHYRVPVRIGNRLDERTLKYVMMVLDVVLRQGWTPEIEEIDFRSGDVAFRIREG